MTPELKTACELIFQEHKVSTQPIKWNSETFRGRISLGLSDLARETLVKKNIIILPNKAKKALTRLNPVVAQASSVEEAEDIIKNNRFPVGVAAKSEERIESHPPVERPVSAKVYKAIIHDKPNATRLSPALQLADSTAAGDSQVKWYFRPVFLYFVWPVCAVIGGAAISFLLEYAFAQLFLNIK